MDEKRGRCDGCQGELYAGEQVFRMDGKTLCRECFRDWVWKLLDTNPDILAGLVGAEMKTTAMRKDV